MVKRNAAKASGIQYATYAASQGKSTATVSSYLLRSIGSAAQPDLAQLASDFQLGPSGSVSLNVLLPRCKVIY